MSLPALLRHNRSMLSVLALLLLFALTFQGGSADATHQPANKVAASGSTVEVMGPNEAVTLLSEQVRTSNPTDLILGVTLECALNTELTTVGNDFSEANGQVSVWIEIDGQPVAVAGEDDGRVVFCSRFERRDTSMFDDEDATIQTFQRTRQANAFNWMTFDVGSAIHTIEVKASLTTNASENAQAMAAIGRRTLIIEPVKSANDETLTDL